MRYFRKIDIDHLETIKAKTLEFVEKDDYVYYRFGPSFNHLDLKSYLEYVPEVEQAFAKYNLKCRMAVAYVMWENDTPIHKDTCARYNNDGRLARINLPVLNCEGTLTSFYSNADFYLYKEPTRGQPSYRIRNPQDLKFEGSVEIDKATVMRISEAHQPVMNLDRAPRITLSLGFNRDPVFLLDGDD